MIAYGTDQYLPFVILFIFIGTLGIIGSLKRFEGKKVIILTMILIVVILYGSLMVTCVIHSDEVGIDQEGKIYAEGQHYIFPYTLIEKIDLNGTINVNENLQIQYTLTPKEIEFMGKDFKQKIKDETVVEINNNQTTLRVVNLPQGVDSGHIKLITKLTPFYL